ncbi:MAG: hypothetical protein AAFQ99_04120 [Pseudomonadota bacterium]
MYTARPMEEYANTLPESLPPDVVCVIDDGQSLRARLFRLPEFTSSSSSSAAHAHASSFSDLFEHHAAALTHRSLAPEHPIAWAAFADWVSLAADLRDVRVSGIPKLREDERVALTTAINGLLESDSDPLLAQCRVTHVGDRGFLISQSLPELQFSAPRPRDVIGHPLRDHPMLGLDAALIKRLQTEIQMTLHAHAINQARAAGFEPLVSGLWLYGAGVMPRPVEMRLPPLRVSDPVWRAVWQHVGAEVREDASVDGTVVLASESTPEVIAAFDSGRIKEALLIDDDGAWRVRRRSIWRRWVNRALGNRNG